MSRSASRTNPNMRCQDTVADLAEEVLGAGKRFGASGGRSSPRQPRGEPEPPTRAEREDPSTAIVPSGPTGAGESARLPRGEALERVVELFERHRTSLGLS